MRLFLLPTVAALLLTFYSAIGQKLATQPKAKLGTIPGVASIVGQCAVIVRPDTKKVAQMKSAGSTEDYEASVNDYEYYVGTSVAFLNAAKVRQIQRQAHGTLVFKNSSGQYFKVPLANVY